MGMLDQADWGATCVRRTALIAIYELKSFAACISVGITVA